MQGFYSIKNLWCFLSVTVAEKNFRSLKLKSTLKKKLLPRWKVTGKGRAAASVQKSKKTKERNGKVQNVKQKCKTVKYDLYNISNISIFFLPLWKPSLIASCTAILYIKDCWLHFFILHIASNNAKIVIKTWENI